MASAAVDTWQSWSRPMPLAVQVVSRDSLDKRDATSQRDADTHGPDDLPGTSSTLKNNYARGPSASLDMHVHSPGINHDRQPSQLPSGGPISAPSHSPPRQLASSLPLPVQNQHPFPTPLPLPPPPPPYLSPMLTLLPVNPLRRANKLRKPSRISVMPPVLAPLSFIEEPELDLDFERISHNVQHSSSHQLPQSLTLEQDVPPPDLCHQPTHSPSVARKLTKRRKPSLSTIPQSQIVPSSSGAAAAAAATGNPAAPVPALSQISPPIKQTTHRAKSDVGHGLRSSLSLKRSSIIRRLSMRSPRQSFDTSNQPTSMSSGSSGSAGHPNLTASRSRWSKWRGTASEHDHHVPKHEPPVLLPLVRVTSPISINLQGEDDTTPTIPLPPVMTDLGDSSPTSPTVPDSPEPDPRYSRPRTKFTLEGNESELDLSTPTSGTTTPTQIGSHSHSEPPSRTPSAYNPQFLSPLSRHETGEQPPRRRWTFAMAMTDEGITDEVLVEELERMRLRQEWSGSMDDVGDVWDGEHVMFGSRVTTSPTEEYPPEHHQPEHSEQSFRHSHPSADLSYTPSLPLFPHQHRNSAPLPDVGSTQHWQTTRRVLLTCRELVRTERHYLASLQALLASETETAPPPLMLRYAEELVKVSELYLAQMERNPSAWGVAAAFVGVEEAIDGAFVGWCGVVGMWFNDGQREEKMKMESGSSSTWSATRTKKLSKPSRPKLQDEFGKEKEKKEKEKEKDNVQEDDESSNPLMKKVSSWRRSMTSIADLSASVSNTKREKGAPPPPAFYFPGHGQQRRNHKAKKPPVRDLAILPTQRIMRYVLLYRDLLAHTPSTSSSRALIKRASDVALRIAQKCDRAQTNSAFIVDSRTGPVPVAAPNGSLEPPVLKQKHDNHIMESKHSRGAS